jgi:hypothetical protein
MQRLAGLGAAALGLVACAACTSGAGGPPAPTMDITVVRTVTPSAAA